MASSGITDFFFGLVDHITLSSLERIHFVAPVCSAGYPGIHGVTRGFLEVPYRDLTVLDMCTSICFYGFYTF